MPARDGADPEAGAADEDGHPAAGGERRPARASACVDEVGHREGLRPARRGPGRGEARRGARRGSASPCRRPCPGRPGASRRRSPRPAGRRPRPRGPARCRGRSCRSRSGRRARRAAACPEAVPGRVRGASPPPRPRTPRRLYGPAPTIRASTIRPTSSGGPGQVDELVLARAAGQADPAGRQRRARTGPRRPA